MYGGRSHDLKKFLVFLAAMSSSRSDNVSKFMCLSACVSGVNVFSLEQSKHLKLNVTRVLQGCLLGVHMVLKGCLMGVSIGL